MHSGSCGRRAAKCFDMNRRITIILCCALVLSVCASYLVYRIVNARTAPGQKPRTVDVTVAARDLAVGSLLRGSDLQTVAWAGPLPRGVILKRDDALSRGVISAIYEGEPLTENRLSSRGSGGGLSATIPLGMRACAVRVNEVVGVAGFAVPGMRVDVLISGLVPGVDASEGPRVKTLLQNIEVLSAGTNFMPDREGKPEAAQVVNLLVTPAQAEMLSLAGNEMHIQLLLRNPMDQGVARPPGAVMAELLGGARTPDAVAPRGLPHSKPVPAGNAAAPVRAGTYTIEISNGAVHTVARFPRLAGEP